MLYVRLAHTFQAEALDQFDNPAKAGANVGRKSFDLVLNAGVEQFNDPRHPTALLHFCNETTESRAGSRLRENQKLGCFETGENPIHFRGR